MKLIAKISISFFPIFLIYNLSRLSTLGKDLKLFYSSNTKDSGLLNRMPTKYLDSLNLPNINDLHLITTVSMFVTLLILILKLSKIKIGKLEHLDKKTLFIWTTVAINSIWILFNIQNTRFSLNSLTFEVCDYQSCVFQTPLTLSFALSIFFILFQIFYFKNRNWKLFFLFFTLIFNILTVTNPLNSPGGIYCCGYDSQDYFVEDAGLDYDNLNPQWSKYGKVNNSSRFDDFTQLKKFIENSNTEKTPYSRFPWIGYGPLTIVIFGIFFDLLTFFGLRSFIDNIFLLIVFCLGIKSFSNLSKTLKFNINNKIFRCVGFIYCISIFGAMMPRMRYSIVLYLLLSFYLLYEFKSFSKENLTNLTIVLLIFSSFPIAYAVDRGNIDIIFLYLLSELILSVYQKKDLKLILLIGCISSIKFIYIYVLALLIVRKLKIKFIISSIFSIFTIHLLSFLYIGNFKEIKVYIFNFFNFVNLGSTSPVAYTGHNGSLDSFIKQFYEILKVGFFSTDDGTYVWGFWNLIRYNFEIQLLGLILCLAFICYRNLKYKNNSFEVEMLIVVLSLLIFSPSSPLYRFVILLPLIFIFINTENNQSKGFFLFASILISNTDIFYFPSYLEIVSTSSIFTFLSSSVLLSMLLKTTYSDVLKQ